MHAYDILLTCACATGPEYMWRFVIVAFVLSTRRGPFPGMGYKKATAVRSSTSAHHVHELAHV